MKQVLGAIPDLLTKKSVSWADEPKPGSPHRTNQLATSEGGACMLQIRRNEQLQNNSPQTISRERPVTRSMSPLKHMLPSKEATSPVTRSISSANPMILLKEGLSTNKQHSPVDNSSSSKHKSKTCRALKSKLEVSPEGKPKFSILGDSMSRKLDFGSIDHNVPKSTYVAVDAPSFDICLDDPPEPQEESHNIPPTTGLPAITSSNEDQFYGPAEEYEKLWDQFGEKVLPTDTCSSGPSNINEIGIKTDATPHNMLKEKEVIPQVDASHDPNSKTPVPQPPQKRIIKPGKAQSSPYLEQEKNVTKNTIEIYNAVCKHGKESDSTLKEEIIIDYGSNFIYLPDLADSVAPRGWMSNSTCEIGLHVLSQEMAAQKKFVMPLVIANKLRDKSFHTKDVKRVFAFSTTHRLDHKEQIMFPVLQNLNSDHKIFTGHYYLINLNLKAERFEIMDSLRNMGDKSLIADSNKIIDSIKILWSSNYKFSKIKIEDYETIHVTVPKQLTTYDCGYLMLKHIECWDGRRMLPINPVSMPSTRMLFVKKWLEWVQNKISWAELLFAD